VIFLTAAACASPDQVTALEQRMQELGKKQLEIETLKTSVTELRKRLVMFELQTDSDKSANLTPGNNGYTVVRTDHGPVTVSFDNVQPYANGSRVTLRFGNLTSATLTNVKISLSWGNNAELATQLQSGDYKPRTREVSLDKDLRPGAWTSDSFVLEGVAPQALDFVGVESVTVGRILLFQ
jgi:hypothetical protein